MTGHMINLKMKKNNIIRLKETKKCFDQLQQSKCSKQAPTFCRKKEQSRRYRLPQGTINKLT